MVVFFFALTAKKKYIFMDRLLISYVSVELLRRSEREREREAYFDLQK